MADPLNLWAFWNYDFFPFLCHGRINQIGKHGSVEIVDRSGYFYRPRFILPTDEGEELGAELIKLKDEQCVAVDAVNRTYIKKLNELLAKYDQEPRIKEVD